MKPIRMALVGATGAVGREVLDLLESSPLELRSLRLLASPASAGQRLRVRGQEIEVEATDPNCFGEVDLVLLAVSSALARELAPEACRRGAVVIDNSSAFRGDPELPLVVPELNGEVLDGARTIIANPNCSTIISLMALGPLARSFGLRSVVASTYQAVSGAGAAGLEALEAELRGEQDAKSPFPAPIAQNLIPAIGRLGPEGETDEEQKMRHESRKILGLPDLDVVCTCVRVATRRAHAISLVVELAGDPSLKEVEAVLAQAEGLRLVPDPEAATTLMPRAVEGRREVLAGRLRKAGRGRFALFVVGDQLLKGAALNALQIAERLKL